MQSSNPGLAFSEKAAGIQLMLVFRLFSPHQLQGWPSSHGAADPVQPVLLCKPQTLFWQAATLALASLLIPASTTAVLTDCLRADIDCFHLLTTSG